MILITGGTGFLGAQLVRSLAAAGKPLRCIYREESAGKIPEGITEGAVEWMPGNLLDVISLETAMEGVEQVFHCAGVVSFQSGSRQLLQQVNVEGTANVVNAALERGVKKMVHVSSVAAIGRPSSGSVINESCKWEDHPNNSVYALSKYLGEMEVWRGIGEGLPAVIVNPSVILGGSANWDEGSSSLVKNAYKEFPWYTRGVNGFVDVRDVVKAMVMLMDSDITGERFILNGDNWAYRDLFTTMAHYLHKKPPFREAAPWMGNLVWRIEKLKSLFSGKAPLLTRETARTAQLRVYYENNKILEYLPGFQFTPMKETLCHACSAFLQNILPEPAGQP